jgi:hypothetical protein
MATKLNCQITIMISEVDVRAAVADAINRQYGTEILPDRIEWVMEGEYDEQYFDGASIELRLDEAVIVNATEQGK